MNANIYRSIDGTLCGMVENFDADRYENASNNPEGHVQAGSVLEDADCKRLYLCADELIYALTA